MARPLTAADTERLEALRQFVSVRVEPSGAVLARHRFTNEWEPVYIDEVIGVEYQEWPAAPMGRMFLRPLPAPSQAEIDHVWGAVLPARPAVVQVNPFRPVGALGTCPPGYTLDTQGPDGGPRCVRSDLASEGVVIYGARPGEVQTAANAAADVEIRRRLAEVRDAPAAANTAELDPMREPAEEPPAQLASTAAAAPTPLAATAAQAKSAASGVGVDVGVQVSTGTLLALLGAGAALAWLTRGR